MFHLLVFSITRVNNAIHLASQRTVQIIILPSLDCFRPDDLAHDLMIDILNASYKKIIQRQVCNAYFILFSCRNIDVEVYVGLSKEEALEVSTIHNQQQEKLDTTFQVKFQIHSKVPLHILLQMVYFYQQAFLGSYDNLNSLGDSNSLQRR